MSGAVIAPLKSAAWETTGLRWGFVPIGTNHTALDYGNGVYGAEFSEW